MNCAYCGRPSEKEYSIDVTLPMHGDRDVWICNVCGQEFEPTIEEMVACVESIDPLVLEIMLKRGEIGFVPEDSKSEVRRLTRRLTFLNDFP